MDQTDLTSATLSILNKQKKNKLQPELFINGVNITDTYLVYRALYDGLIDPDETLNILIDSMYNNSFLASCAHCFKFNANPNKYIRLTNYGEIHILSYVYIKVKNEPLRNNLIYMLLLDGSNPQLFNYKNSPEERSVSQWFRDNFPNEEMNIGNIYSNLQAANNINLLRTAAVLMNKNDSIDIIQNPITSEEENIIILARSDKLYDQLKNIKNTISFFNAQAFVFMADNIAPNYLMSNQILMRMVNNRDNQYVLQELAVMLSFIVNRGVYMDEEQYFIVRSLGKEIMKQIDKAYKVPYWKKTCANMADNNIDDRLKSLAVSLGIEPTDKAGVCNTIDNISKSDPQKVIVASLRRQKTIMLGEIANINELIEKPPNMVCRNRADFDIDPMGYNNLDVSSYRDATGAIWCFLSETYPDLILNQINPYTGQVLSDDFIKTITEKLQKLKDLGIYKTMPINKAIEKLKVNDKISNNLSNEMLRSMFRVMEINEINVSYIENMSVGELQQILDNAGISITILPFRKKHVLYTIAWIFNLANDDELNDIIREMQLA